MMRLDFRLMFDDHACDLIFFKFKMFFAHLVMVFYDRNFYFSIILCLIPEKNTLHGLFCLYFLSLGRIFIRFHFLEKNLDIGDQFIKIKGLYVN